MTLAEAYFGSWRDVETLAFIFGRNGVGAGIAMQKRILRGISAGAGEIGHTIIKPDGGARCRCGQYGCLETLVAQPALMQEFDSKRSAPPALNGAEAVKELEEVLAQVRAGDKRATTAVDRVANYLGIALTNLVNTLNPELIVLGGMYAQGADLFLPRLRQKVAARSFGDLGGTVRLEASSFGLDAGVVGAASVALVKRFYEQSPS